MEVRTRVGAFYAVSYLWSAKAAGGLERVVAYNQAGRKIAECRAATREGNVCHRPQAPPSHYDPGPPIRSWWADTRCAPTARSWLSGPLRRV